MIRFTFTMKTIKIEMSKDLHAYDYEFLTEMNKHDICGHCRRKYFEVKRTYDLCPRHTGTLQERPQNRYMILLDGNKFIIFLSVTLFGRRIG